MTKWSNEISEFNISYESIKALKAQVFAYFIIELTPTTLESYTKWKVFIDESSNNIGIGFNLIHWSKE